MICTFAGHREVFGLSQWPVVEALETLLSTEQELICYEGGMREFDRLCACAVRTLKSRHQDKRIRLILVLPYMYQRLNTDGEYCRKNFDEVIVLHELAQVHYKKAVTARNRWMVDQADQLIALVWREHGGAWQTLQYAQRRGKHIVSIKRKENAPDGA